MISVLNNLDKPLKVSNNRISSIKKKPKNKRHKNICFDF